MKMATHVCLDLYISVNGRNFDLRDELRVGKDESYDEDVQIMTERLVSQLGSLDVALDEKFGGDHNTSCDVEHHTGHSATVKVYLDHEQTVLIGEGEMFASHSEE
jgi:hypothetical protein